MRKIKVWFLDWFDVMIPGASNNNIFLHLLNNNYEVVLDRQNPDVLFYALNHNRHLAYKNCIKIFVCSEPGHWSPELLDKYPTNDRSRISVEDSDLMITSYNIDDPKYFQFPYFSMWAYHHIYITKLIESFDSLTKSRNYTFDDISNKKFCIYLHLNNNPKKRRDIFSKLTKYKRVDSNLYDRNIVIPSYYSSKGGSIGKINFIKDYKFSFAMANHYDKEENSYYTLSGLIDEKIIESFIGGTIPLFYGNDKITDIFNKNSFLNWHDFNDDEKYIEEIIKIDNDDSLYLDYLNQPIINNLDSLRMNELSEHLKEIIG